MSGRAFVDTNVLVYVYDRQDPAKQQTARGLLGELGRSGDLVLSTQVLQEFYVTVTRKLAEPLAEDEALTILQWLAEFRVVPSESSLVLAAAQLSQSHKVSLWDALILEAARSAGAEVLYTEDLHDGWELGRLRVENPFEDR